MWIEAIYHCTYLGGNPNYPTYHIGDRIMIDDNKVFRAPSALKTTYFVINGLVFDMGAFKILDISKERDEKIKKILE